MSRTLRRKDKVGRSYWNRLDYYLQQEIKFGEYWVNVKFHPSTMGYNKGLALYTRDKSVSCNKEPRPSWFRNLTVERPLRRKHKNELRKVLMDREYEPEIISKGKLKYWT